MSELFKALKNNGCDVDDALRRFVNNETMYRTFLLRFVGDPNFGKFESALRDKDYETIHSSIHTFKGLTGNLGLTKLYSLSTEMMNVARTESYSSDKVTLLNNELQNEYAETVKIINDSKGE